MKCPKCQPENPEGMKFCGECKGVKSAVDPCLKLPRVKGRFDRMMTA